MRAAFNGREHVVALLLESGARVNEQNADNATALMLAAERGQEDAIEKLLDGGARIDHKDSGGMTAFMKAAQRGHVHAVRWLQEAGAHINMKDDDGDSALMLAVVKNKVHVVKALLAMRTLVNDVDNNGDSALMVAAQQGRIATVQLLLDAKAEVNAVNAMGWTPLMIAAMNNRVATVRALLDGGADTSPRCLEAQKTALDYARAFKCKGVIRLLEEEEEDSMSEPTYDNGHVGLARVLPVPPQVFEVKKERVLFFDGGCRGNPGPGAAGWVLVDVHPDENSHRILSIGSFALEGRTTNNIAEYTALKLGFKAALDRGYQGIHVVGDSLNIVRQMKNRHVPDKEHLRPFYHESMQHANNIGVCSWTHHYRPFNAMANAVVQWAMNTRSSSAISNPDTRDGLARTVDSHLEKDVNKWLLSREDK